MADQAQGIPAPPPPPGPVIPQASQAPAMLPAPQAPQAPQEQPFLHLTGQILSPEFPVNPLKMLKCICSAQMSG